MTLSFPSQQDGDDRRADPRIAMTRPAKVQCVETGRYLPARTSNMSAGGALVEVDHPSLLVVGQKLRVGVAWTHQQAILSSKDMVDATVVRSMGFGKRQSVALSFSQKQQMRLSA